MAASVKAKGYPVRLDVAYPEGGNRFMILVRWFLAIPHSLALTVLSAPIWLPFLLLAWILTEAVGGAFDLWYQLLSLVPLWGLLIVALGRLPDEIVDYFVGLQRYSLNVGAYVLFHDEYPPFSMSAGAYEPVTFEVDRPASYSRALPLVKWLLAIPHAIVLFFLGIIAVFVYLFVWLAVLFTGVYPRGAFNFLVGYTRWSTRLTVYRFFLLVDDYPPFSLDDDDRPPARGGMRGEASRWRSL